MNDRGMIELKQARHPLIDKNKVVPVDVMLGKENPIPARIVCVRNKSNRKDWLAFVIL